MRRRSSRSFGTSPSRLISTIPFPRFSRSGCSSSCRASAKSATASFATADFWWATAIHRAMLRPRRKPSSRRSSFSRRRRRGGGSSNRFMQGLAAIKEPIDWPAPDSEIEDWIFAASALIFVEPTQSERARQALRRTLGARRVEYLLALLAFIRAAHYWTVVHPGLEIEDDVRELMSTHKELASLAPARPRSRVIARAFPPSRMQRAVKAITTLPCAAQPSLWLALMVAPLAVGTFCEQRELALTLAWRVEAPRRRAMTDASPSSGSVGIRNDLDAELAEALDLCVDLVTSLEIGVGRHPDAGRRSRQHDVAGF